MTTEETKENPKKEVVETEIIVTDSEEIPKGLPPEDMLGDILINGDGKENEDEEDDDEDDEEDDEQDEEDENEDEQDEDDHDDDDGQEPRPGESMTDYYNRVQREKDEKAKAEWVNVNNSYQKPNSPPPVEEEKEEKEEAPKGPKKKYEGEDAWKNLGEDDQEENAIKLTILFDTFNTEMLRKFIQMYLVEGKVIREVKMVVSNFKKRAANSEFVYLDQEDYIKALEAYIKLYEQDIPMPNNLKRALAKYLRGELHKWLSKNADSPLIGLGLAAATWIGEIGIKVATIKTGLKEPEITQEEDEEEPETFVNIDHIQND
jgi:hypothetical protein